MGPAETPVRGANEQTDEALTATLSKRLPQSLPFQNTVMSWSHSGSWTANPAGGPRGPFSGARAHSKVARSTRPPRPELTAGAPGRLTRRVCDSGSQGREFKPHAGHGDCLKKKQKTKKPVDTYHCLTIKQVKVYAQGSCQWPGKSFTQDSSPGNHVPPSVVRVKGTRLGEGERKGGESPPVTSQGTGGTQEGGRSPSPGSPAQESSAQGRCGPGTREAPGPSSL